MKKLFSFLIISLFIITAASAQLDRSQRPQAGPAPVIQLGDFDSFTMDNGIKVIVVENRKVPVVSFQLTLDIDPLLEGEAAGYVSMAGSLLGEGTTSRTKAQIDESIDFIGANISTGSTGIFASSLTRHTETLLDLMSDILLNPSFPEAELQRMITQNVSAMANVRNNAGAILRNISTVAVYGENHPYGEITTEESLKNINVDLIRQYYNTYFKPNVAYMVIVGDINAAEARQMMNKYFAQWKPAEVPRKTYAMPKAPQGRRVVFGERPGAVQSALSITYPVEFTPGHEDAIKASVMNAVLGGGVFSGRLMQNLREDKGWTYGARSSLSPDRLVGRFSAGAEIRNSVTDSAATEILYEMHRLRNEPVTEETVELVKSFMNGSFARSLESPRTIANFALNIERHNLPEDYYKTYLEKLSQVNAQDVQDMARKYLKPDNAIIAVAGNSEVIDNLRKFNPKGEVEIYDAFGRRIIEDPVKPAPAGVTAESVLENYINAIGGRKNLNKIKDLSQKMTASMMGQTININFFQKAPNKLLVETAMGGMVLSKQVFDGQKAIVVSPMGQQEFTEGVEFEMMRAQATLNAELHYKALGITKTLLGVEKIDGHDMYKIEATASNGTKTFEYYDVVTGLKMQVVSPQGNTIYGDYRTVGKVKFPHSVKQQMGPQMVEMTLTEVKLNTKMKDDIFQVK